MSPRVLATVLLLSFAPAAAGTPAWAQSAADDGTTAMARARFKEGVAYYEKGQFELARASFLQAYALKKHPAILINLGLSCLKSGHALEASRYFKQFLAESKDITEKQRADANDGISQAHAKLGQIEIVAAPGSEVTVDAEHVGTTPLSEAVVVEIGAHMVKVRAPDGTTDSQSVTVIGGEKATARFEHAPAAAPSPAPAPAQTSTTSPPSTPPPPPAETPSGREGPGPAPEPQKQAPPESVSPPAEQAHGTSIWPVTSWPIFVGLGLVVASAGATVGWGVFAKKSAQDAANTEYQEIIMPRPGMPRGSSCTPPIPASPQGLADACQTLINDNNQVNQDATIGNVAIGIGAAAAVGTIVYWIVAKKRSSGPPPEAASVVRVAPVVSPSFGALSVSGSF